MNFPRYNFSKEAEPQLLRFLKVAREEKERNIQNCNLKSYEVWKELLPPDPLLIEKLAKHEEDNAAPVVDLCSDEEIQGLLVPTNDNEDQNEETTEDNTSVTDVAFAIQENLRTQHELSDVTREHLKKCSSSELENLFEILEAPLNNEEIYYLGICLQSLRSNDLITFYCHHLLMLKIRKEFCDKILILLDQFSVKYSSVLEKECVSVLQELADEEIDTFLQYLKKLSMKFQASVVRNFILAVEKLNDNYLIIIETLLNNEVEYEALNKFVEMLSNVAEDHDRDKKFGKLLMTVVEALGPNLVHLEQPLKHIIAGHKSVWKVKLEKNFQTCYEDSLMFTQSFRD